MGWQTFTGVRQSGCNGFYCSEVAEKEPMQRWMLIKCFLALTRIHLNEWRHTHGFLELLFRFYFASRVRWLTIAVGFHSITRTHTQTHTYILITKVCSLWSGANVKWASEGGGACTCEHTHTGECGSICKHLSPSDIETCTDTRVTEAKLKAYPPACCRLALCVSWEEREQWESEETRLFLSNFPRLLSKMIIL